MAPLNANEYIAWHPLLSHAIDILINNWFSWTWWKILHPDPCYDSVQEDWSEERTGGPHWSLLLYAAEQNSFFHYDLLGGRDSIHTKVLTQNLVGYIKVIKNQLFFSKQRVCKKTICWLWNIYTFYDRGNNNVCIKLTNPSKFLWY